MSSVVSSRSSKRGVDFSKCRNEAIEVSELHKVVQKALDNGKLEMAEIVLDFANSKRRKVY